MNKIKYLPKRMTQLRENKKMSKYKLGMSIGTTGEQIKRWEMPDGCCIPSVRSLIKICEVHGVEMQYFFEQNFASKQG